MTEDVTLVVETVRSDVVVSGAVPGPPGPTGPEGPPGQSGTGAIPATPNTLLQRDAQGSGNLYTLTTGAIAGAPSPPETGLPSNPILTNDGTLDPTATLYYHVQLVTSDFRVYTFPEQTVAMSGHTAVNFDFQQRPTFLGDPAAYIVVQRSYVSGNYSGPDSGAVVFYPFSGSETYPLRISDTNLPVLGQFSLDSTTSQWNINPSGITHRGPMIVGSGQAINQPSADSNDGTFATTAWSRGRLPDPGPSQIGGRLIATTSGRAEWHGGSTDTVNVVLLGGQSNAMGANAGGPNPASPLVRVWDPVANAWGSSDITQAPWTASTPNGNLSKNNMGLAFAHRLAEETGRPTFLIFYFVGGTSIDHWVKDGNTGGNGDYYDGLKARLLAAQATPELSGKTTVDAMIYAQGEEDYTRDFATYLGKLTILDTQLRAETYFRATTPLFITGMSGLHDRYQITWAHQYYCANVNSNCKFVNSRGLKTQYDIDQTGDYTHWLGQSLWDFGHDRIWAAYAAATTNSRVGSPLFFGRNSGPATSADPQIICMASSMVSYESRDLTSPGITSLVAGTGTFAWGYQCAPDGNYTQCMGYNVSTSNLCNYTQVVGRDNSATDNADYCQVSGYQNVADATYSFVTGRGNTAVSSGSFISGTFAEVVAIQTDPVTFQHGVGTTTSNRKSSILGRASGAMRIGISTPVANLPSAVNAGAGSQIFASNGNNGLGCQLISDGTNWRKMDEMSGFFAQTATTGTVSLSPLIAAYLQSFRAVTMTGNIVVNPLTTNVYAGMRLEIWAPASLGSFTFTVNGSTRAAGSNTILVYNGSAWVG